MAKVEKFSETDIPYGILEQFGMTEEMVEDLPLPVMNDLLAGKLTPVIALKIKKKKEEELEEIMTYARFCLLREDDGTVDVQFVPVWSYNNLEGYTDDEKDILLEGKVLIHDVPGKGVCYVQFDNDVNQVMAVPVMILSNNIKNLANAIGLTEAQIKDIHDCKVVEIEGEDDTISIGIDLKAENLGCLRPADGDSSVWRDEGKIINLDYIYYHSEEMKSNYAEYCGVSHQ
ncbi:MAG: DUF4099 domain-containing protein [Prevotella sp.]|nr:DUF4099 domain-containing protein [Prevotella sp.]